MTTWTEQDKTQPRDISKTTLQSDTRQLGLFGDSPLPHTGGGKPTLKRLPSYSDGETTDETMAPKKPKQNNQPITNGRRLKKAVAPLQVFTQKNGTSSTKFSIAVSNAYEELTNKDGEEVIVPKETAQPKRARIPPITVKALDRKTLTLSMNRLNITKYRLRLTSVGTNIFVEQVDDYKKILEALKTEKIAFFTHDLPGEKQVKVVLRGLDKMEHEELTELLKECGVCPSEIKTITPRQSRYSNHANYVLSFNREGFDMKDLQMIKAVNYVGVRWEYYRRMTRGPVQCRRCMLPGHGTRNCNLVPRCMYCAQEHLSEDCKDMEAAIIAAGTQQKTTSMEADGTEEVIRVTFTPKCCNCDGPHVATSPECKARADFLDLQRRLAARNRKQSTRQAFAIHQQHFPELPSTQRRALTQDQHRPATQPKTYSQMTRQDYNRSFTGAPRVAQALLPTPFLLNEQHSLSSSSADTNSNLFSYEEITSLLHDVLRGLKGCRDRSDQFQVITNLAIKYVYNGSK